MWRVILASSQNPFVHTAESKVFTLHSLRVFLWEANQAEDVKINTKKKEKILPLSTIFFIFDENFNNKNLSPKYSFHLKGFFFTNIPLEFIECCLLTQTKVKCLCKHFVFIYMYDMSLCVCVSLTQPHKIKTFTMKRNRKHTICYLWYVIYYVKHVFVCVFLLMTKYSLVLKCGCLCVLMRVNVLVIAFVNIYNNICLSIIFPIYYNFFLKAYVCEWDCIWKSRTCAIIKMMLRNVCFKTICYSNDMQVWRKISVSEYFRKKLKYILVP